MHSIVRFFKAGRYQLVKLLSVAVVVALFVTFNVWAAAANTADAATQEQITEAERAMNAGPFSSIPDGVYEGSAQGYGGPVVIDVTLENGYIIQLDAVDHTYEDEAWWEEAVALLDTIPAEQTTNVDVVSGATYSSAGIINATKDALASASEG